MATNRRDDDETTPPQPHTGVQGEGYRGPIADVLGGADISWIVSLVATSLLYYQLARKNQSVPDRMILPSQSAAEA